MFWQIYKLPLFVDLLRSSRGQESLSRPRSLSRPKSDPPKTMKTHPPAAVASLLSATPMRVSQKHCASVSKRAKRTGEMLHPATDFEPFLLLLFCYFVLNTTSVYVLTRLFMLISSKVRRSCCKGSKRGNRSTKIFYALVRCENAGYTKFNYNRYNQCWSIGSSRFVS